MDIEHGIYKAILATLGQIRSDMWFGNSARIDVLEAGIRIHAINAFAAEWVGKYYLPAIQSRCHPFLKKRQRIEIVSQDSKQSTGSVNVIEYQNTNTFDSQLHEEPPIEKTQKQPRFNAELLAHKPPHPSRICRFSDVLMALPVNPLSGGLSENTDNVTSSASHEKRVVVPFPANRNVGQKKKSERKKSSKSAPAQNRRLTPQEFNKQIITKGKGKLAAMTPPTSTQSISPTPVLKRDEANRNIVFVSGRPNGRSTEAGSTAMTWNNFVAGPSNHLAVRAAELAIYHSGKISPIYIFGPTSVGKTHLLEAIKAASRNNPQAKPLVMMTAEQFTSSFIDGLKQGMPLFRNKFRGISAMLIDDVQFFAGKDSTQTEFLRTIDQLKSQGVQIVLTGDRPLNSLADLLKPEIIARLEAGMSCEIKPADHVMLLAIFKQMAASRNIKLSDDVCEYVVSRMATHARQLSGAINRLHAAMLTSNRPVTLETSENILEDMIRNNRRPVRLHDIEKAVCETMQLSGQVLQSKSRAKQATQPRMLAMWLARKYTRSALSEIGKYFGNRSHSTVVSAQKKVDQWLRESPDFGLADSPLSVAEVIQKVEALLQTH